METLQRPGGMGLTGSLPLIVTCAITGEHQRSSNSNIPLTLEEQVEAAAKAMDAGAAIIHVHGRDPLDPTRPAQQVADYRAIAAAIRDLRSDAIVDFTQATSPIESTLGPPSGLFQYSTLTIEAGADIVSLSPGPMTFRANGGRKSSVIATTFDDAARFAEQMRAVGVKPQVFLYHPGHLDLLRYLMERDLLALPIWVQLVFGQQSGISADAASVLYMVQQLPPGVVYQVCGLEERSIEVALLAIALGGHVRTGMEDALYLRPGEPVNGNEQLVARVVRIAREVGRRVATPAEAREILGIPSPST